MQKETNILEKETKKIIKINNNKLNKFKMDRSMETKIINKTKYNGETKTN
jgi:indole-3-glycerol phosphate synthase